MQPTALSQTPPVPPDLDLLAARYADFEQTLVRSGRSWRGVLGEWDGVRRELLTYEALTDLRFNQNTADPQARKARETLDELKPAFTAFDDRVKRRFVGGPVRSDVEAQLGPQALQLWEHDVAAFAPEIEADLAEEAKLVAAYGAVVAAISVSFRGERLNLAGLARYEVDPDRDVRYAATAARWTAFAEAGPELDRIFDRLVRLRDRMAKRLGYPTYVELAYRRRHRIGYDSSDVARWRDAIVEHVVPVAAQLVARGARRLGVPRVALWDEKVLDGPEPLLPDAAATMMETAIATFAELDLDLASFAATMQQRGLIDLVTREGKRGGAYCTFLASHEMPFVFANGNGSHEDVKTLMHEFGHAFQAYRSRALPLIDYVIPTYEAAEIHSMSLEYLTWPGMARFFGDGADAYRRAHLTASLLFLPYGAAVDHFQHLVYARPEATPEERHAMWRQMEARYLPWRTYGDLARPAHGAFWQSQLHVFTHPFYYIDYTLALCCALQFWAAASDDGAGTVARYRALCDRGGSQSFGDLVASAGLRSPFAAGALGDVVARARVVLGA